MLKSGLFDSTTFTVNGDGFPVGNRAIDSETWRKFIGSFAPNGVPLSPSDNLEVTAAGGMDVSVAEGIFAKKGAFGWLDAAKTITLTTSTSDQVIYIGARLAALDAQFVDDDIAAYTTFVTETDTAFARITIPANATAITSGMIEDLRGNRVYCGYATDLRTQAEEAIAQIQEVGVAPHKSTHGTGGTDALSPSDIGAAGTAVDNLSSTSATAALSANQGKELDESKMGVLELLWTNSAPTSSFAAQTISLDLSAYEAVYVLPYLGKDYTALGAQQGHVIPVGETVTPYIVWQMLMRRQIQVTTSAVIFGGGGYHNTYNNATVTSNDVYFIPYKIYGIKRRYAV